MHRASAKFSRTAAARRRAQAGDPTVCRQIDCVKDHGVSLEHDIGQVVDRDPTLRQVGSARGQSIGPPPPACSNRYARRPPALYARSSAQTCRKTARQVDDIPIALLKSVTTCRSSERCNSLRIFQPRLRESSLGIGTNNGNHGSLSEESVCHVLKSSQNCGGHPSHRRHRKRCKWGVRR